MRIQYTRLSGVTTLPFVCGSCRAEGEAELAASTEMSGHGHSGDATSAAMSAQFARLLDLARCPRCRARARGATTKLVVGSAGKGFVVAGAILLLSSLRGVPHDLRGWVYGSIAAVGILFALWDIVRTLSAARRGVFIDLRDEPATASASAGA